MLDRHIITTIEDSLKFFPAVLLNGARQVGKSTLVEQLVKGKKIHRYISLDDITVLESANRDPQGFIEQFTSSIAIDEVQRVPNLILAIKRQIDSLKESGKFLLTGSANILSYPNIRDSLAGRMDIVSLEGLSFNEAMRAKRSCFIEDLINTSNVNALIDRWFKQYNESRLPPLSDKLIAELIFFGSFPEVMLKKHTEYRNKWFASYITAYVEKDIRDLSKMVDIVSFAKLLRIVGLRTGNLLNNSNLSIALGLDHRTIVRYIELLEISFQITTLQPWSSNLGKRYIKTPKIYMNDVGLASYFCGINDMSLVKGHQNYGHLLETWVFSELRKSLIYHPLAQIFFYRNHQGIEVDFLITQGDKVIGIECKSSASLTAKDYKNLRFMQAEMKNDFIGIVLYRGEQIIKVDDNIIAVPLGMLFLH